MRNATPGRYPDVEGVQRALGAGHAEVRLEVSGTVPGQRGHPLPAADPQMIERVHELLRAPAELGVGVTRHDAGGRTADHLRFGTWFGA